MENTNNYIRSALDSQFDNIQMNLSQKVLELMIAQSKISQNLNQLDTKLENSIPLLLQYQRLSAQIHCGPGLWHRLVYLNMTDPSQQCPSAWREYNDDGVRACGRPENSPGNCASVQYIFHQQYNRVCGRIIIGYQFASPDAFESRMSLDEDFTENITKILRSNGILIRDFLLIYVHVSAIFY